MKILLIDSFHQNIVLETNVIPRIGDSLGCFNYKPFPIVQTVLLFIKPEFLEEAHDFGEKELNAIKDIDIIVYAK
jgi:hypothetical protein